MNGAPWAARCYSFLDLRARRSKRLRVDDPYHHRESYALLVYLDSHSLGTDYPQAPLYQYLGY